MTCLSDQVVQKRLVLAARALVRAVQRARVQVGDAGNVAAELRDAILDGRDLDQQADESGYLECEHAHLPPEREGARVKNVRHTYLAIEVRHRICAPIARTILRLR